MMKMTKRSYGTGSLVPRGDRWYGQWRVDGRLVKRALGPKRRPGGIEGLTRKQAEVELRRRMTAEAAPQPTGSKVTFAEAAAEFLRYKGEVSRIDARTVRDYRGVVDGYLLDEFGDLDIDSITPSMIDAYKETLIAAAELSNRTIVRHLTVLNGIFKRAKRAFGLAENPASADLVERPKAVYTGEFDTFERDEVELLAVNAVDDQDAAIFKLAAFTGLRQGELLALRWQHVDFVAGMLHVKRNFTGGVEKVPKSKRVRSVPMMPRVIDTLARLKGRDEFTDDDDLVFTEAGDHVDHYRLRRRYYEALERAGLRRIRFHDLRHCFGSAAITTLDPYAVQSYMGHQHYSTTQRYLHHKPRPQDAARLADAFGFDDRRSECASTEHQTEKK